MKVLCIIPCYNAQSTLKGAIESIINQSYTNWELIIVDDASTDKSYKIAQSYAKKYPNITVLRNHTNQGCYYSRNRAFYYMKDKEWDVFTVHDADDTSTHDRFKIYVDMFLSNSLLRMVEGVFQGKRYNARENKIYYTNQGEGVGISFYKREVFSSQLGYFDNTRFSGDSDYRYRILYYITLEYLVDNFPLTPIKELCSQITGEGWDASITGLDLYKNKRATKILPKYAYTYTTGLPQNTQNLSQEIPQQDRDNYKKLILFNLQKASSYKDLYYSFTPKQEDL
jgi:glycosyltransferase involved in cell wall biosynthesis